MTSIAESLKHGEALLAAGGVADPRREAVSLMAAATNRDKTLLYAHPEFVLSADEDRIFDSFLHRRSNREPFQYISGVQEFYGLEFEVTPDVLIPRPETEMVVDRAIEILDRTHAASFCEVGIGSGCIAVSVLHHSKRSTATGLDVSSKALLIARRNAEKHNVIQRMKLRRSDVYEGLSNEQFDLILSNPPYIPTPDIAGLQAEVRDFEPHLALIGGPDGLDVIRTIVAQSPRFLRPNGFLLMEIGIDQSAKVAAMFDPRAWQTPDLFPDLQGIPRLIRVQMI